LKSQTSNNHQRCSTKENHITNITDPPSTARVRYCFERTNVQRLYSITLDTQCKKRRAKGGRVIEVADAKLMGRFVSEKSKKGTENQTTLLIFRGLFQTETNKKGGGHHLTSYQCLIFSNRNEQATKRPSSEYRFAHNIRSDNILMEVSKVYRQTI